MTNDERYLTSRNLEGVTRVAERTGWSVADVINMAVAEYLRRIEDVELLREIEKFKLDAMMGGETKDGD